MAIDLEYENWFVKEVEKGLSQAARGELMEHDELVARIEQRLKEK
jgi:predicted transcriptional regulator